VCVCVYACVCIHGRVCNNSFLGKSRHSQFLIPFTQVPLPKQGPFCTCAIR